MVIIGKPCPPFKAFVILNEKITTMTEQDLRGHYTLLFFYAADFSAVCPTEIYALQANLEEFKKRNVEIVGISIDSIYTHAAWLRTPREKGGITGTTFKLLSDAPNTLSKNFGIYDEEQGLSFRGTFLINENLVVTYGSVNNRAFGRSVSEILRVIDAIQFAALHGVSCPANWQVGQEGLKIPFKVSKE